MIAVLEKLLFSTTLSITEPPALSTMSLPPSESSIPLPKLESVVKKSKLTYGIHVSYNLCSWSREIQIYYFILLSKVPGSYHHVWSHRCLIFQSSQWLDKGNRESRPPSAEAVDRKQNGSCGIWREVSTSIRKSHSWLLYVAFSHLQIYFSFDWLQHSGIFCRFRIK